MSLRLCGATVASPADGSVAARDVYVAGGRVSPPVDGAGRVDASGCVVVPGNVCAHHHLYSVLARGMPGPERAPRDFPEILERVWWRLDRALDHETTRLSALLGCVEAARAGTTTIVDHHASPEAIDGSLDALADGIEAAGLRAAVCYEATDRHGEARGRAGVAESARFLRDNRRPLVRGMAGAHASFTLGPATLDALVAAARAAGAPIHVHVAEDACDQRDALERYGMRVVHRLRAAGALSEGDVIAHGVHLDDSETEAVRASGAWVAHNPRSNMNNRVGRARAAELGARVALGTDGIDGDVFAEARACYLVAREASHDTGPAFALDRLATGARVAGMLFGEPALGTLAPGAPADLVVLDYRPPTPLRDGNLAGHVVFGMGAWSVRDVMVAGRWVVRDRRHVLVDEDELAARCREAAPRLWARMEDF